MSDDLSARLRDASVPLTLEMAMEGYVQDSHAVALHAEAADRIDADARRIEACDAEMDRLNSALMDALAERDAALAEVRTLCETLDPLHQTLSFLRSVIASGEPMSPDVRQAIDNAQERLRLADTEEADDA